MVSGEIDIDEVERCAVGRRAHIFGEDKCGAEIFGNAINPVGVGRIVRGKRGRSRAMANLR